MDSFYLVRSFVTLLVITDPVGLIPIFLAMTGAKPKAERNRAAWQAVAVAGLVIAVFAVFGQQILGYLGISLPALQAAGGLLLLVIALDLLSGNIAEQPPGQETNIAFVPLGTPLLAGPGSIAAIMVFRGQATTLGQQTGVAAGLLLVLVVLYLSLRFAGVFLKVLRRSGVELVTRVSGLLLAAIAVQLVADAVKAFIQAG